MKVYLAILNDDARFNEDFVHYFNEKEIEVIQYYPKLRIVKLISKKQLESKSFKYIKYLELDREYKALDILEEE